MRDLLRSMLRLRPYLRGGRYLLAAAMLTTILAGLLDGLGLGMLIPLLALLLGDVGDEVGKKQPMKPIRWVQEWLPGHDATFYVLVFCVVVLGVIVLKNGVLYLSTVLATKFRGRITTNLRDAIYRRLHNAELYVFEQRTAGEIASVFSSDTMRALYAIDHLVQISQWVSVAFFYVVTLVIISWPLTLVALALAGVIGISVTFLFRRFRSSGLELTRMNQRMSSMLVETFAGIRVVRATNSQERELQRFHETSVAAARVEQKQMYSGALLKPIVETVAVTGAMVIVSCAYIFFVRTGMMSVAQLMGFGVILVRLLPQMQLIYGAQGHLLWLGGGITEVEKYLAIPQHPRRPFGGKEFDGIRRSIRFDQVIFTYPTGKEALRSISFEIQRGKTVALVGASGSGKTTVANLLLRLRDCTSGCITVDDLDFWEFTPASWHRAVAVVEQEAFLFHDTLAHNIAYGFPDATPQAIQNAVRIAHLEDVIRALPQGLETTVGERGMMLSGGQRQRLAIARAVVRNPQILILDEATSALDSLSERQVQIALEDAMQSRTALVIAHRLSTIRHADHIVVLDAGQVAEQGTWEELVARRGKFAKLVNLSMEGTALVG